MVQLRGGTILLKKEALQLPHRSLNMTTISETQLGYTFLDSESQFFLGVKNRTTVPPYHLWS